MGLHMKRNISNRARRIAKQLRVSYTLVEEILKADNRMLRQDLEAGERVVIDGLTTITPYRDSITGMIYPRGRVSSALRERLKVIPAPAHLRTFDMSRMVAPDDEEDDALDLVVEGSDAGNSGNSGGTSSVDSDILAEVEIDEDL